MNLKRSWDSIIGSIIFVASLTVSVVCYASIIENLESTIPKLGPIALGDTAYNVYQDENCAGRLQVQLEHDKTYHLLIDTVIKVKSAGKVVPVRALVEGFFNAIGQLQTGKVSLQTSNSRFKIESEGVTPIQLNIDAKTPFIAKNFDLDLPGPVEILETSPKVFGVRYAKMSGLPGLSENLSSLAANNLKIREVPIEAMCKNEDLKPIDASKLLLNLNKLSGAAAPYLQEFSK